MAAACFAVTMMPERLADAIARVRSRMAALPPSDPSEPIIPEAPDGLPWCDTCQGRRYVRRDVPITDPDFGRAIRCLDCPGPVADARRADLLHAAGLGEDQLTKTFASFEVRPGTEKAYKLAYQWAIKPHGWLVIHGTPDKKTKQTRLGQGKTHLACAVTNALLDKLVSVHWWYAPDAVGYFQQAMATHENAEFLTRLQHAGILVLDDLGAVRATENSVQQFLEPLFNYRERNKMPTLVTCIGDPESIKANFSESIGRRFQDVHLCRVVGLDADQYVGKELPF